jgi:hypothetical protein
MVNYEALLKKYMRLVVESEDWDFLCSIGHPGTTDDFTPEERSVLEAISKEVKE